MPGGHAASFPVLGPNNFVDKKRLSFRRREDVVDVAWVVLLLCGRSGAAARKEVQAGFCELSAGAGDVCVAD